MDERYPAVRVGVHVHVEVDGRDMTVCIECTYSNGLVPCQPASCIYLELHSPMSGPLYCALVY